jgi:hypothetical protein
VEGATNLTGYHLEIGFDPSVIKVTDVVNGGFLVPPDETALYEPITIDNVHGLINFGLVQQGDGSGDPNPKSDEGVLLEITFQGVVPNGSSPITIDDVNSILVDWPEASAIEFDATGGYVSTVSCPPPTDIALTEYAVPENEPEGTGIGNFYTIDSDVPNDTFTYELVSGAGEDDNDSFEIVGSSLKSNEIFNYEDQWIYRIRVRSTDWGGKTVEKAFLIFVLDMNDPPIANNQSVFATQETPIDITLTGSDEDGDALTYEIVSGPTDGVLSGTAPNLTYTPGDDFFGDDSFTFRVFDGEDYSEPATVTIFVDEKKGTDYYFPIFVN